MQGYLGRNVPQVDSTVALQRYRTVNAAQEQELIASCHDLSDGGLGVALAETAFAGGFGMQIDLAPLLAISELRIDTLLFSESQSRLLVTVSADNTEAFEALFAGQDCACIGDVVADTTLTITGIDGETVLNAKLNDLKQAWQAPLREL